MGVMTDTGDHTLQVGHDYETAYGRPKCMVTGISHHTLATADPTSPAPENPITLSPLPARDAYAEENKLKLSNLLVE